MSTDVTDIQKFTGGRLMTRAAIVGVVFLALSLLGVAREPKIATYSYLVAFTYWAGIAFGALAMVMIFHAFQAKWVVVVRRAVEGMAVTVPLFLVLFIPIALGMAHVYSWVQPGPQFTDHEQHLLHMKAPYLNVPFFLLRTAIYLIFAGFIAHRLFGLSVRQDESGDADLTRRQRAVGTGLLPFFAIVFSFAAFDWLMSLDPIWFSTIFGVYYFAGSFHATIALLIVVLNVARGDRSLFGEHVTVEHTHNLGKLLFAFTAFWGYIAFSQFMLIWIAGLPEEIPFYITRMKGAWAPLGVFLMVGHFALPFLILLSREIKRRPKLLALPALWVMFMNFIDLYWLVMPTLSPEGPVFHWTLVTAFVGIGALAIAYGLFRLRGRFTIPVKDPFLSVSLRYRQP